MRALAAPGTRWRWLAVALFATTVAGTALVAASGGVRGSDQYWYVADSETLIRDQSVVTNNVFPVGLLGDRSGVPPPFVHNILSVYLAALPGFFVGAMGGWLVLNVTSTLLTSLLIFGAARRVASPWAAATAGVLYALLPIVAWHTAQPLAEASTSLFGAIAIYALSRAGAALTGWIGVVLAVGLLYLSRQSYMPLLVLVPIGYFFVRARERPAGISGAVLPTGVLVALVAAVAAGGALMFNAENVNFSYTRLLHTAVPGQTDNMWFNFDLSPENLADELPYDARLLGPKIATNLADQVVAFDSLPIAIFYWTFNALVILAGVALLRNRDPVRVRLILAALALVAVHLITIALFQNQFRYMVPAIPALLVVLAIVLSDAAALRRRLHDRPAFIVLALTLLLLAPNLYLARTIRDEGLASATGQAAVDTLFDQELAADEPTLIAFVGTPQMLAYAVRPRPVLYVLESYTEHELERLLEAFPAGWLFAPVDSPLVVTLAPGRQPAGAVQALGEPWGLYRLP